MRALVAVLLLIGCAPLKPVTIGALAVDFPNRDRGAMTLELVLPDDAGEAGAVTWSLFVEGSRFASGIDAPMLTRPGVVAVQTALLTHHLSWREGAGELEVGVQGTVQTSRRGPLRFENRQSVSVHGRPVLTLPIE